MTAARVAKAFRLDPVAVYGEQDVTKWLARVAAYNVIAKDEKTQADASKRK